MSLKTNRIRRQHLIREAEGYLELIVAFDDIWPMEPQHIEQLAGRALQSLAELESKFGSSPRLLFLKGQAYRLMHRYSQSVFYLHQASLVDAENIDVYLALAWCYKRMGRLDLAVASLEQALEIDYSLGIVHYNLACYWALAGQVDLATRHLGAAFDIDGSFRDCVSAEPDFDPIRAHPSFTAIVMVSA